MATQRSQNTDINRPSLSTVDGGFQSLEHIANWVRFADTKATILTAGLGVVVTMLMTNSKIITTAITSGCVAAFTVGILAIISSAAFLWTLFWLMRAISPQRNVSYAEINRFAWPSLANTTPTELIAHINRVDVQNDTWHQVIDLSKIAARKFNACNKAVRGFASLAFFGFFCLATAIFFTS
ncbi:hypothetical protein [Nocardiopsis aegyptia]